MQVAPGAIAAVYEGDGIFAAKGVWAKRADAAYTVGEVYSVEIKEDRSTASHNAFFAAVSEAWSNLGEDQTDRFPTAEHLRKWALVKCGYRDERSIVCTSKAEAQRVAAFVRPMDGYAVVVVRDAVVVVYTAQSQSYKAMGRAEFQRSKEATLQVISSLIGVSAEALTKEAEKNVT